MTANRIPHCLEREIRLAQDGEFPVRYEPLVSNSRIIGLHFHDELWAPYENRGLSSMIAVCWRGSVVYIAAPVTFDPESGAPYPTPYTYAVTYEERVAWAVEGIRRFEADYQRQLFELDRSR